jgi:hypothetical protein
LIQVTGKSSSPAFAGLEENICTKETLSLVLSA